MHSIGNAEEEVRPRRESLGKSTERCLQKKPTTIKSLTGEVPQNKPAPPQRGLTRRGSVGSMKNLLSGDPPRRGVVRRGSVGNVHQDRQNTQLASASALPERGLVRRGSVGTVMVQDKQSTPRRGVVRRGSARNIMQAQIMQSAQAATATPGRGLSRRGSTRSMKIDDKPTPSVPQDFPGVPSKHDLGYGDPPTKDMGNGSTHSSETGDESSSSEEGKNAEYWKALAPQC